MLKRLKSFKESISPVAKRYKHLTWTALVPLFFISFMLVEKTVTTDYWVSYSRLDDFVPFVPEFVIFYFMWYPLLFLVGLYLMIRDAAGYRRYIWALMSGFFITLIFYLIVPNGQNLRPGEFVENTVFTRAIGSLYSFDTNTNVIPSMHVIGTMVAAFAVFDAPGLKSIVIRMSTIVISIMINLSTVFIKQHSVLDIFAGLGFCIVLYIVFYIFVKRRQNKFLAAKNSATTTGNTV